MRQLEVRPIACRRSTCWGASCAVTRWTPAPTPSRLQVDENGLGWEQAWSITRRTFACACHILLLDKSVYEVLYEARNRPNWLVIR